jgi:hypothetical protein
LLCAPSTNKQLLLLCAPTERTSGRKKKKSTENFFVGFEPTQSASQGTMLTAAPKRQWNFVAQVNYST